MHSWIMLLLKASDSRQKPKCLGQAPLHELSVREALGAAKQHKFLLFLLVVYHS